MEQTLDFKVIFFMLRKKLGWIIVATVLGAVIAFLFSEYMLDEKYTSSAQIYITNTQELDQQIDAGDLSAARTMASTYCIILQSEKARSLLSEQLATNQAYINSKYKSSYTLSVSVRDESEVLRITSTSRDPELSAAVCNEMINVSSMLIEQIFDGGQSHSLGDAMASKTPSSPNIRANMLTGAIVACVVMCALLILWAMLDNRVKDEADFVAKVKIPVLGEVPSIHENIEIKDGYYYAYSKKQDN